MNEYVNTDYWWCYVVHYYYIIRTAHRNHFFATFYELNSSYVRPETCRLASDRNQYVVAYYTATIAQAYPLDSIKSHHYIIILFISRRFTFNVLIENAYTYTDTQMGILYCTHYTSGLYLLHSVIIWQDVNDAIHRSIYSIHNIIII